jgi:putative transposase
MIDESVAIYNSERPHCSLQLKTPDEVHRASLAELLQPNHPATKGVNL